jgi:hypothetical protein
MNRRLRLLFLSADLCKVVDSMNMGLTNMVLTNMVLTNTDPMSTDLTDADMKTVLMDVDHSHMNMVPTDVVLSPVVLMTLDVVRLMVAVPPVPIPSVPLTLATSTWKSAATAATEQSSVSAINAPPVPITISARHVTTISTHIMMPVMHFINLKRRFVEINVIALSHINHCTKTRLISRV